VVEHAVVVLVVIGALDDRGVRAVNEVVRNGVLAQRRRAGAVELRVRHNRRARRGRVAPGRALDHEQAITAETGSIEADDEVGRADGAAVAVEPEEIDIVERGAGAAAQLRILVLIAPGYVAGGIGFYFVEQDARRRRDREADAAASGLRPARA